MNSKSDTKRLEYFSDAVIAIAATLLAVELHAPSAESLGGATLPNTLAAQWSLYLAFLISFLFIGIAWSSHHDMFRHIAYTDHILLILNLFFLMGIALQPFSTSLLTAHFNNNEERSAALIYHGILFFTSLCFNALWHYSKWRGLVVPAMTAQELLSATRKNAFAPLLHFISLIVASWSVVGSFVPLLLLYVFFAVPKLNQSTKGVEI